MSLACLALSLHAEGGVIAGEGNCPRSDNKSLFIGMQPGIPAKPWKWDECGASQEGEEGHQNSPSSSAWYPARGAQPAWDPPPLHLSRRSSCTRKPGVSAFRSRWLLAPKWGSPVSSKEDTSVSLNCLRLHPSSHCPPWAPAPACCGAAVCLFSNWDCCDTPEDKKAQGRNRKAAARRSPMEMLHLLPLFLFASILISQLK